jgi:hypothetical protein
MASKMSEETLPGVMERRRILAQAGIVLAEARSLRDCLDRLDSRASPEKAVLTARMLKFASRSSVSTYSDRLRWSA